MNSQRTPNPHGEELVAQLRMLRERAGLTQEQAGAQLGGSRYQLNRIENGRIPGHDELLAILDLYQPTEDVRTACLSMWDLAWRPDGRRVRPKRLGRSTDS